MPTTMVLWQQELHQHRLMRTVMGDRAVGVDQAVAMDVGRRGTWEATEDRMATQMAMEDQTMERAMEAQLMEVLGVATVMAIQPAMHKGNKAKAAKAKVMEARLMAKTMAMEDAANVVKVRVAMAMDMEVVALAMALMAMAEAKE